MSNGRTTPSCRRSFRCQSVESLPYHVDKCMSSHSRAERLQRIVPLGVAAGKREACFDWPQRILKRMQATYRMANLRGLTMNTGVNMSAMQVANIAAAASSKPPKTSKRSQRLTMCICQRHSERKRPAFQLQAVTRPYWLRRHAVVQIGHVRDCG